MDTERFLAAACELLAVPSTADRPGDLHRALSFVVDFVGPGFTVERFESGGKPSALIYRGAQRPRFQIILNAHLDVVAAAQFRPRRDGDRRYARGALDMKVSALAEAWLDIRFPPEGTDLNGKTAQEVSAYLAAFCEPGVTPVVDHADPPHHADRHRPEICWPAR